MADPAGRPPAREPEDLDRLFLHRAQAGDVEGVVALYEPDAVFSAPSGELIRGTAALRAFYTALFADPPAFTGTVNPAVRHGDLALTTTHFDGGATAEIARRQPDGSWLWIADQANVLGSAPPAERERLAPAEREARWDLTARFAIEAAGEPEARSILDQALAQTGRPLPLQAAPALTPLGLRDGIWIATLKPDLTPLSAIKPDDANNRCRYVSHHFPGGTWLYRETTDGGARWDWPPDLWSRDPHHDDVLLHPAIHAVMIWCRPAPADASH